MKHTYYLSYDFYGQLIEKKFADLFTFYQELSGAIDNPHILDHTIKFRTDD